MNIVTVKDWVERLKQFPEDWPVVVSTTAGGGIVIEHREMEGKPVVAIFGSNGGRFGENPLTDEEYAKQSARFLRLLGEGYWYTRVHGDHRLYMDHGHVNDTCYGVRFDDRVVDRMIANGLLGTFSRTHDVPGVRRAAARDI